MPCDVADQNYRTNMELAVKCGCLGDELGQKTTFITELCMVRDGQLFVELDNPDMKEIFNHSCLY